MLQPIFADYTVEENRPRGRRSREKERRRDKDGGGIIRGGRGEMPINESAASARSRLGCEKEQSSDQTISGGRTRRENSIAVVVWCDSLCHKTRGHNARLPLADELTLGVSSRVCHRRKQLPSLPPRVSPDFSSTSIRCSCQPPRSASRKRTQPLLTASNTRAAPRKIRSTGSQRRRDDDHS